MRVSWILLLACLPIGCQGLTRREREPINVEQVQVQPSAVVTAKFEDQVPRTDDALSLAATCIEKGDSAGAIQHMKSHIRQYPDQIMIRAYFAELLLKANNLPDAQDQFERFIAAAQDSDGPPRKHLLHCHTRLMEIAQTRADAYREHLHRGIGMVLLARQLESSEARAELEQGFRERLLCKAAAELTKAKKLRPDEPRPLCYLAEAYAKLEQPRSAEKTLKQAKALAAFLPVTPAEQRALSLAR